MSTPTDVERIMKKHPGRIPVYVSKASQTDTSLPDIQRRKFLIPQDFTITHVYHTIRQWLKLRPEHAIFIFINNSIPDRSKTLLELYEKHRSPDGLLRITYSSENTFG